ncbi:unnamed protein product [Cylindrotheca closterium]|uniref:CCHC-type domain-containing protein n=1 Tax=Cylindrotheca closterium TaxID=2856 RepID=A0AAD2CPT0_9STRA|nr:unnamed protein product [Cylindrotheca closterium]
MGKSSKRLTQVAPEGSDVETKRIRRPIVEEMARTLIDLQARALSFKDHYGEYGALFKQKQKLYPWLTRDMVTGKKTRILKQQKVKAVTVAQQQEEERKKKVGRPKGSTKQANKDVTKKKDLAKIVLTERYANAMAAAKPKRLTKGAYGNIHDAVMEELELGGTDFLIPKTTIQSRAASWTTIALANSLVKGSELEDKLKDFHSKIKVQPTELLGKRWFKGFMNRHRDILNTGRGSKQDRARKDWTTYENVQQMYELVYEQMLRAGIAVRLPESEHYWVGKEGQIVDSEDKAAGHKCTIKLIHPEYLLFGDEVGTDTAQDQDGHIGGETYIKSADGQKVELLSTKASGRFTVMGLTAASGDPVMCIVIIAGKELAFEDYTGFDHQSEAIYDGTKTIEENYGPGKALPGLPVCVFRGKEVPGMVAVSPKGSMTSEILKKALETLDKLGVYPRTLHGPTPMCLFDGHDSRLQVPFLEYINSKDEFQNPLWIGCIGLPNGTAKWQVGDSVQQNGSFKMAMTREKKRLVMHKIRMMHPSIDIKRSDIIPLIHKAWTVSFARKEQNLHAIIARGWYHLDMRLLKDTDILNTRVAHVNTPERSTAALDDSGTPPTPRTAGTPELVDCNATADNIGPLALLNMNVGNSEIMIDLVQYMRKNAGAQAALQERKRKVALRGNAHEGFFKASSRAAKSIWEKTRMQKYEKLEHDRQKLNTKPITVSQLAIWFSVRKTKADKIPKRKDLQIALMEEWAGRPILTLKQYLLDQGKDEMYVNMVFAERASIAAEAEEGSDGDNTFCTGFLCNCDRTRKAPLMLDLQRIYCREVDYHPKTVSKAQDMLNIHMDVIKNPGVNLYQGKYQPNKGKGKGKGKPKDDKKKAACYVCGKEDHMSPKCPNRLLPEIQWKHPKHYVDYGKKLNLNQIGAIVPATTVPATGFSSDKCYHWCNIECCGKC